ncbi:MAG: hypothetical protein KBS54_01695 [Synergistaceae bacterium]|nr:hypothetical protein [Candidatus Equadaptatus faecalis]
MRKIAKTYIRIGLPLLTITICAAISWRNLEGCRFWDITCSTILNIIFLGGFVVWFTHINNMSVRRIELMCQNIEHLKTKYLQIQDLMLKESCDSNINRTTTQNAVYLLKSAYIYKQCLFALISKESSSDIIVQYMDDVEKHHTGLRNYIDIYEDIKDDKRREINNKIVKHIVNIINDVDFIKLNMF